MIRLIFILITLGYFQLNASAQNSNKATFKTNSDFKELYPQLLRLDSIEIKKLNITNSVLLPKTIFTHPTAFFCRMENKLAKSSQIPVKFRLGCIDYVNKLEGK